MGTEGDGTGGEPMRRRRGVALTERDRQLIEWMTRHGMVTASQISRRFFGSLKVTWRRLLQLERLGLIRRDRVWVGMPRVVRATPLGVRLADVDLGPAPLDYVRLRHHLAVVDLSEELLRGSPEARWVTERELRRNHADLRGDDGSRARMPDGLLVLAARRIAVELDLTPKRSRRLDDLVGLYAADRTVDAVWWFLPSETAARRMRDVIHGRGLENLVEARLRRVPDR